MTETSESSWPVWPTDAKLRLLAALLRERWRRQARPQQLPPVGDWRVFYLMGGRGSGKSRAGAETLADWILGNEPGDWAIIAPTYGDARDVCVESESGLLAALAGTVANWNRSTGEIIVANGARGYLDGADDGALRIQGKNLRGCWCDEIGLWGHGWRRAWEESIRFAVRIAPALIVATGTPKAGHSLVKMLLDDPGTVVTKMRTLDNAANLDPAALAELLRLYQGKRLGLQELEAEFLEDVEGELWSRAQIERLRASEAPPLRRVVVGVDPQGSSSEAANAGGVVVVGVGQADEIGYVLADQTTTSGGPRAWARAAVDAYHRFEADRIVAEKNFGGEMVRITIHTVDPTVPVKLVNSSQGKRIRAEPVASLYEGDESNPPRMRHVGVFPELETEMVTWTPGAESPNRIDALVFAVTELGLWAEPPRAMRTFVPRGRLPVAGDRYGF